MNIERTSAYETCTHDGYDLERRHYGVWCYECESYTVVNTDP